VRKQPAVEDLAAPITGAIHEPRMVADMAGQRIDGPVRQVC
jgi:hypothetical protein